MHLIAGLGNPGGAYALTRHNVGFMLADRLAAAKGASFKWSARAEWTTVEIAGREAVVIKPATYMNLSGVAVAEFMRAHSAPPESLVAVYDDCDLPLGRIRIRRGGGSGGHRGVASIIEKTGSAGFVRLRLGIGRPPAGRETKDYVLTPFRGDESGEVEEMLARALEAVEAIVLRGAERAMNEFNASE